MKFIKMEEGDAIAAMIKRIAEEYHLNRFADIQPRYLAKPLKNNVGAVYKWNDISATLTNKDNTVVVAVYGEAFDRVDEPTQEFWIRNLLTQITYDFDKDKVGVTKDFLTIPLDVYQAYGEDSVKKKELEVLVLNQLAEEEKEKKIMEKEAKKASKKK